MKAHAAKEGITANFQRDSKKIKEVEQTLKSIHERMMELYHYNFPYFTDVKILKHSAMLNQLIQRIQNDLEENGIIRNSIEWKQVSEALSKNLGTQFFENLAFYNPPDDALYLSEEMAINYPTKMLSVCAHELSEKLLFTIISQPAKSSLQSAAKLYLEGMKDRNANKNQELLNIYVDAVFKTVFKEGCCEAIALQVLCNMGLGYETEVASLEKELQTGCSKCMELLFHIENTRKGESAVEKDRMSHQALDKEKLAKDILRSSQIIKGVSYYLGYALAKAVLEKFGIEGVRFAVENYPPLKAEYFANPQTYLTLLEKQIALK
jgi:hypothetical protein